MVLDFHLRLLVVWVKLDGGHPWGGQQTLSSQIWTWSSLQHLYCSDKFCRDFDQVKNNWYRRWGVLATDCTHEHSNMSRTKDGMKPSSQPQAFVHSIFKIIFKSWNPSETWFLMPLWWIFIEIMNTTTNRGAGMILTLSINQLQPLSFTSCNPINPLFCMLCLVSRGSRSFRWR